MRSDPFLHSEYNLKHLPLSMKDEEAQRLGKSMVCMSQNPVLTHDDEEILQKELL